MFDNFSEILVKHSDFEPSEIPEYRDSFGYQCYFLNCFPIETLLDTNNYHLFLTLLKFILSN